MRSIRQQHSQLINIIWKQIPRHIFDMPPAKIFFRLSIQALHLKAWQTQTKPKKSKSYNLQPKKILTTNQQDATGANKQLTTYKAFSLFVVLFVVFVFCQHNVEHQLDRDCNYPAIPSLHNYPAIPSLQVSTSAIGEVLFPHPVVWWKLLWRMGVVFHQHDMSGLGSSHSRKVPSGPCASRFWMLHWQ